MPWIQKTHKNPVTNLPLSVGDLIRLHFHKNTDNQYSCPITYKVFGEHTHIVFVRTSGNVYAYDAVEQLNIKVSFNAVALWSIFTSFLMCFWLGKILARFINW